MEIISGKKIGITLRMFKQFSKLIIGRLCQLSLFGASIKSIGASTCTFLVDELLNLNKATSDVTEELSKTLEMDGKSSFLNKIIPSKSVSARGNSLLKL